ncbi:DUF6986 family protein [Mycobacterium sp.]|uniref:DUF6986 family protein n=1 Tax=Mycobacterium sp. TaxID=1785 RepID=UPI003BAC0FB5
MKRRFVSATVLDQIGDLLAGTDAQLDREYRGDRHEGQPLHTVYVAASDAGPDTVERWAAESIGLADRAADVLEDLDLDRVMPDVLRQLEISPVQDLRIDFEDGYGWRDDAVEDSDARRAGTTLGALSGRLLACGIRIKGLTTADAVRAIRTLELTLDAAGDVPQRFVFTVPKLRLAEQASAAVKVCEEIERAHGLLAGSLRFELQIESPQAVIAADGTVTVARAIQLSQGRCSGLHYGTYDYSAACGIAAPFQSLDHPVADYAKAVMQVAAAQTGVWVCDGSTQVVPTGSAASVASALRRHHELVRRSLCRGYYQGWDMHPGHLVTRWLANFGFFRSALSVAAPRLQAYLDRSGGSVIEEPATAEALAAVVVRGLCVGVFDERAVIELAPSVNRDVLDALLHRCLGRVEQGDHDGERED